MKIFPQISNTYLTDPDVQAMLKVQKGSKVAFEELMHKYYPRILNFIYRFVGNKNTAEDLTQEVFLRAYNSARRYRPKSKFQTWLYTIAKNIALNELRRSNRPIYSLDAPSGKGYDQIYNEIEDTKISSPDEQILQKEKVARIRSAISNLPGNQRIAVILRRYEGFSYAEIAATLSVSEKAVKSLLNRAKENLKNRLEKLVNED